MKPNDLPNSARDPRDHNTLLNLSDLCVACGLCLPHCPTYRKTLSEADSPRGRIMLMRGVLESRIPANRQFFRHIDLCLTCRACERACPNGVAYGALVDGVRAHLAPQRPASALRRFALRQLLAKPRRLERITPLLRWLRLLGTPRLLRGLGMREYLASWPQLPRLAPWRTVYPAGGAARGAVGLFLGCVARATDAETLRATVHVLNRLGYTVHVPQSQTCCGALHRRSGEAVAEQLAAANRAAFDGLKLDAIISSASGCGAELAEYPGALAAKVFDISAFLEQASGWGQVAIAPLAAKVAVHDPCSLRNVQRAEASPYRLLARIPALQVEPLPGNELCCGAAGTYFLEQPDMAQRLRDDKMQALRDSGAQYLATSNVGCAMYLADGLHTEGRAIEVLHPITLLARQMGYKEKI